MNEFGEPNMGNPSVRFDEGRESVGHWPCAFQSNLSCLLYGTEIRLPRFTVSLRLRVPTEGTFALMDQFKVIFAPRAARDLKPSDRPLNRVNGNSLLAQSGG